MILTEKFFKTHRSRAEFSDNDASGSVGNAHGFFFTEPCGKHGGGDGNHGVTGA